MCREGCILNCYMLSSLPCSQLLLLCYLTHFNAMHINEENVVPNNAIILDWVVTNILWDIPMCLILKIILRLCYTTTSWLVVK